VKLLLDEMYPRQLAERLRNGGHDVVGVVERGDLVGRPDLEIARWAREQERVVVTENVVDFVSLDWLTRPRDPATFSVDWL
jgi:predicted nuclease of predicted toxin-antitoxin system